MMTKEESVKRLLFVLKDLNEAGVLAAFHHIWDLAPLMAQNPLFLAAWVRRYLTYGDDSFGNVRETKELLECEVLLRQLNGAPTPMSPKDVKMLKAAYTLARLQETWPTDGWDGAAEARRKHHEQVRAAEKALQDIYKEASS